MEHEAREWLIKAKVRAADGVLDRMVAAELFDHTWMAAVAQIERNLGIEEGHVLLDAGCGWGRLIVGLKHFHPFLSIDGYELAPEFVRKAEAVLHALELHHGVRVMQGDLTEVSLPAEHYDSFYSSRVMHYIEDKETVIRKLYESLKRGGRGMIIIPNRLCPYRWLTYRHAPLISIHSIGKLMAAAGFTAIRYGGYGFLPARKRFKHDSPITILERSLSATPLKRLGGLAYVVGDKPSQRTRPLDHGGPDGEHR